MTEEMKSGLPMNQYDEEMFGFEEAKQEDQVIPRIKVINALSPERKEKIADEGELLNSLTKEKVTPDMLFIPIKMYYSNIWWNPDRGDDQRMFCRSADGRIGVPFDGGALVCKDCKKNLFDNTKQGKDAQPLCTSYMNFLGFFSGIPVPVVLSFARTNYNEGKKMLSIAKSLMRSIWSYGYILDSKLISKNGNDWYIITSKLGPETSDEDKAFAMQLYKVYEQTASLKVDYEDIATANGGSAVDEQTSNEI
jgi:hypothetical protein